MEDKLDLNPCGVDIVSNIIEYAQKREHVSKDQLAEFVADLLPEVEFEEAARFCSDEILTDSTLRMLSRK